jgi:hypothetical protein
MLVHVLRQRGRLRVVILISITHFSAYPNLFGTKGLVVVVV